MQRKGTGAADDRRQRLAAELRANLLKRKALARERARHEDEPHEGEAASSSESDPRVAASENGRDDQDH
jgi:hypothetical protein